MRVSREQAERNRREVVASAARLFREHGFDGIGLGEVMRAAGLTHGGFHKQFDSKEGLVREAIVQTSVGNLVVPCRSALPKPTE